MIYPPEPPAIVVQAPEVKPPPWLASKQSADLKTSNSDHPHPVHKYLITKERQGKYRTFAMSAQGNESRENVSVPIGKAEVIEVIADRQEYDERAQIITARGNVVMRFAQSVMTSDRLEINLADRIAVAQDNVVLTRGEQILRGEKFEYYLVQDRGVILDANGEIYQPSLSRDLNLAEPIPQSETIPTNTLSDRLIVQQPISEITATPGISINVGSNRDLGILDGNRQQEAGAINRLRYRADRIDFEPNTWQAQDFRFTNDPFSPPELELRAKTATFKKIESGASQLNTTNSRIVIDDSFSIPLLRSNFLFDSRARQPGLFTIGFDGDERGGLYLERNFSIIATNRVNWTITPQYFLQRALIPDAFGFNDEDEGGVFDASSFGVKSELETVLATRTSLQGNLSLTSLDTNNFEDSFRAKVSGRQLIGNLNRPHIFNLEYVFRDRLFNGSLGFQTVFNSIGAIITSPNIAIGKTGINLRYQGSIQNINADTDRPELLEPNRENDRVNLTRYQGAAFLSKGFSLWTGKPLPSTKEGGLRYTPVPVVPYLQLITGISGVNSFYSNGDSQLSLGASIGIKGQLGHFSRSWFDYTGFKIGYAQNIRSDESPFLFDRFADRRTLSVGITQQIYGPIRLGFQTSLNLDNNEEISTDYTLEYSRRTHNIILRYNPVLEIGSFSLQISDFNWRGNREPFEDNDITPVIQGVN